MRSVLPLLSLAALAACDPEPTAPPVHDVMPGYDAFGACDDVDPLKRPYFGDTHVHTTLSLDANLQGTRLTPEDAYRFAQGEAVGIQPYDADGQALRTVQLDRPLDFVALSDHAEFLGTVALCQDPASPAYDDPSCVDFRDAPDRAFLTINALTGRAQDNVVYPDLCGDGGEVCIDEASDVWGDVVAAAEAADDPTGACRFTAFVGYEWSGGPDTRNLHRNVIFRTTQVPSFPVGYFDEPTPEGLWAALRDGCASTEGCDVLTIPHNSNLSTGLMFQPAAEAVADPAVASERARMEPLVEIFQHKGDSECWPGSPAADELCDFEKLPYNTLSGANLNIQADPVALDHVRDVLGEGLAAQALSGVNPYKYGIVASTDTHLATPGLASEQDFPGHGGAGAGNRDALPVGLPDNVTFNPGGLAVLWAEENSREALFRAMLRKEAYGTSGPRIRLRMFAGRGFDDDLCDREDLTEQGYARGVPMGGEVPAGDGPIQIVVAARSDPGTEARPSVPLERVQIVRGRLVGEAVQFDVIDVAGVEDLDADVDPDTLAPTGEGASRLCTVWTDPDGTPEGPSFWYARVVEVPTARWHTRTCHAEGITCPTDDPDWRSCCDDRVQRLVRERAWSSPVWWTP